MVNDPFSQREAEKYELPIPSREYILQYLTQVGKPLKRDDIAKALEVVGEEQLEGLRRRLRAMERDGQLIFTRRQCYALADKLDMVRGTVLGHRDGYGFLRVEGQKEDYYLSSTQMKSAIHGDLVLAQLLNSDKKGRREARIVRVLEAKHSQIVGRYFTESGMGFVVPDDSRLNFDILIAKENINSARMGNVVVVELLQRANRQHKALGKIVEVLGETMGTNTAVEIALRSHDIPHSWPPQVVKQVADLAEEVPESAKKGRVDLRSLPLVTIDGEDARDFDDAVYCEKKRGGGWRLWVAIADVSYYVRPQTALDNEARSRGTSVYFPTQVVPMLPEKLSNGLCSLNPQVDRLCMVCEMTISAKGVLSTYKFYEAVMNSHARLTYTKVWAILQGNEELRAQYHALVKPLAELHNLYNVLNQQREERGGISFESEEAKFIFNAEKRIERIETVVRNDAHKLIEECMIMANVAAARFVEKYKEPALYRVHDKPSDESVNNFRTVLAELGLTLGGGNKPRTKDYANLLTVIAERQDHDMLQTMLLRSMKQAIYDPENRGHFGLALPAYGHFTSPIRRYPDLSLHRAIKYLLAQQSSSAGAKEQRVLQTGGYHYHLEQVLQLGEHCSMTERRADEATRYVSDYLKCDFMQDQVGQVFNGVISSVTAFGFFVRLNDLFIDGLVHVSSLENDYYRFDPVGQRLIGESGGQTYRLGDEVEIRVEAVSMDERKIDFTLISTTRKVRGEGKTARDKAKKTVVSEQKKNAKRSRKNKGNFEPDSAFRATKGKPASSRKKGGGAQAGKGGKADSGKSGSKKPTPSRSKGKK